MTTKPNPWKAPPVFSGPCYGGPFAASDLAHELERKEVYVLEQLVGAYVWDDDKWLWSPAG